jgi:phospholipid/cholesterol/gamma-HCH transport system permease protein
VRAAARSGAVGGAGFSVERRPRPDGGAELRFAGVLELGNAPAWLARVRALAGSDGALRFELGDLQRLDGGSAALLLELAEQLGRSGRGIELAGAAGRVAEILELYRVHGRSPAASGARRPGLLARAGGAALEQLEGARGMLGMLGDLVVASCGALRAPSGVPWREVWRLMERSGADALPIVALITFLTGLVTAFQAAIQLHRVGADLFVADAVALSMTRELGPLMTAIVAAGRSGAAFAAELGTMRVSEEVDALHTIGLDPQRYLVLPRILALVAMLPLLTLLADAIGIFGGLVVGVLTLDLVPIAYLEETREALIPWDVSSGLLKSVAFALAIGWVGCQRGLATRGGAEGVGRATTSAVVSALFLLIAIDAIFTVLFHVFDV